MLTTPVAYIIFNRPRHTSQTFAAIRAQRPAQLFIIADGPRPGNSTDVERCLEVREIVEQIDWPCEVRRNYSEINLGCKMRPTSGIDWVFQQVDRAIILEDDCLAHPDFFGYCQELLERYKDDERVMVVTGNNFQDGCRRGAAAYYFSKYGHNWGWATWRRAWLKNDSNIEFWPEFKRSQKWHDLFVESLELKYWESIFDKVYSKKIETAWDYPWSASIWYHGGLSATPNVNLVTNIGFGPDGTHTLEEEDYKGSSIEPLGTLTHPKDVLLDRQADRYVFDKLFNSSSKRLGWRILSLPKRIARKIIEIMFTPEQDHIDVLINTVKPHTFCSDVKLRSIINLCNHINSVGVSGDYVECGTYKGGSAAVLSSYLGNTRKLWLYDSFEGMPETSELDGATAKQYVGEGAVDVEDVYNLLTRVGTDLSKVNIVKGYFEETYRKELPQKIALLHCDADWYESVLLTLRTFYDLVDEGGVIILDDFGYWEGAREAFYDFVSERGIKPLLERVGSDQLYWVKGKMSNR